MRLTLRTLLAWLDDTLPAAEVKAISRQLEESPYAKELVARISKVTRQRRLLVPPSSGADAIDPNLVASYLDNELDPEKVAEYERLCLTSSVNLAEAASVHQILSLIGQKAKVPPDARFRMYKLIRGRETTPRPAPAPTNGSARKPVPSRTQKSPLREPITQPIPTWGPEPRPTRNWLETYAPAGIVLLLVAILATTAAISLSGEAGKSKPPQVIAANGVNPEQAKPAAPDVNAVEPTPVTREPAPKPMPTEPAPTEPAATKDAKAAEPVPGPAEFPAGTVGALPVIQGAVLVEGAEAKTWEPSKAGAPVKEDAHLLNLAPFRNTLKLRDLSLTLVGGTDAVLHRTEGTDGARVDLRRGRLAFKGAEGHPLSVKVGMGLVEFKPAADAPAGVERNGSSTHFYVAKGEATIKIGTDERSGEGPLSWVVSADGKLSDVKESEIPAWVSDDAAPAQEAAAGESFGKYFREGRPPLASLVEALDDTQDGVRLLAIDSLVALGDMEMIVPVLNRPRDPAVRKAVVERLRGVLEQGATEPAQSVRRALEGELGDPWGPVAEKLILGYNRDESMNEMLLARLVSYLKDAPFVGVRELALDNLKRLTGRDGLEYDPENPMGKGLKAWEDLLTKKDLTKDGRNGRK